MIASTEQDSRRPYLRELQRMELALMKVCVAEPSWLAPHDESALRWALSMARLSKVPIGPGADAEVVDISRASDEYRAALHDILSDCVNGEKVNRRAVQQQLPGIRELARQERQQLIHLFGGRLPPEALDRAVRRRPLAISLSGGGGTSYVFVGAIAALEEAGLTPDLLTATSMGAILAAFRARTIDFEMKSVKSLITRLSWRRVFRAFETSSRFGLPATLKLYLREVIGSEFERDGQFMRLRDLEIPLRVCVAGITQGEAPEDLDRYAHLLDDAVRDVRGFRSRAGQIARTLAEMGRKPVRPVYLGGDELTREFDVLDAVGFSSAVPGVIHYDILRDDPRMVELTDAVVKRENVFRLVDGGLADNLPTREAWRAVQDGAVGARDPFVLGLDSFAPRLGRHLLFLPLMQIAAANTKFGREAAHLTVTYKNVLSPISVVPSLDEFVRTVKAGKRETEPVVPLIRKMVGPIPEPPGVVTELDGDEG